MEHWDYLSFSAEFALQVHNWDKLEGFAQTAIIQDALHRGYNHRAFWENREQKIWRTGRIRSITAFVKNYVETVESHYPIIQPIEVMWADWGKLLRLLEIG